MLLAHCDRGTSVGVDANSVVTADHRSGVNLAHANESISFQTISASRKQVMPK